MHRCGDWHPTLEQAASAVHALAKEQWLSRETRGNCPECLGTGEVFARWGLAVRAGRLTVADTPGELVYDDMDEAPVEPRGSDTGLTVLELKAMLDRVHPENIDKPLDVVWLQVVGDRTSASQPCDVLTRAGRCVFLRPSRPDAPLYLAVRFRATCEVALAVPSDEESERG